MNLDISALKMEKIAKNKQAKNDLGTINSMVDELGRMIGGWIKKVKKKRNLYQIS